MASSRNEKVLNVIALLEAMDFSLFYYIVKNPNLMYSKLFWFWAKIRLYRLFYIMLWENFWGKDGYGYGVI